MMKIEPSLERRDKGGGIIFLATLATSTFAAQLPRTNAFLVEIAVGDDCSASREMKN